MFKYVYSRHISMYMHVYLYEYVLSLYVCMYICIHKYKLQNEVVFLRNRTLVAFVDKLSSTIVGFIRSEGELKTAPYMSCKMF